MLGTLLIWVIRATNPVPIHITYYSYFRNSPYGVDDLYSAFYANNFHEYHDLLYIMDNTDFRIIIHYIIVMIH